MTAIWEEIKVNIRSSLSRNSFSLWIEPITVLGQEGKTLILGCPNKFSRNWVTENYLKLIRDGLRAAGGAQMDLEFKVQPQKREDATIPDPDADPSPAQLVLPNLPRDPDRGHLPFNRDFTFDRFIVGRSNEFAYSASKELARADTWNYNSLLMLANTGLGKTHLSQAVGQEILHHNPANRVYYITAEQFANEMISSLKNNCIDAFKNKYRRCCDVLLLDEIHFLSGKQKTQMELGYTLDALASDNKKIIFTSSLPPKDVPHMSKELSSRLTSGLVATIERPDYETRVAILTRKAAFHRMALSEEIIHFLAARLNRDIRQMESALHYLKAKSDLLGATINLDMARDVLNCLVTGENRITTEHIKKLVCTYYKVSEEMLESKSRKKIHSHPRNIYAYLCRRYTDETLGNIAKSINRSHSTVLYAAELVEHGRKRDRNIRHQLDFLCRKLTAS